MSAVIAVRALRAERGDLRCVPVKNHRNGAVADSVIYADGERRFTEHADRFFGQSRGRNIPVRRLTAEERVAHASAHGVCLKSCFGQFFDH